MRTRFLTLLLLLGSLCLSSTSQAAAWSAWPQTGSAKLTWAFLDVYNSQLRTPSGKYQPGVWPQALIIDYLRDISSQDLTEATSDQWKALGLLDEANQHQWLQKVQAIWPDVSAGSQITFLADKQGGQFYYLASNNKNGAPVPIGPRFDASFRDAFLAIWLSPSTQYPQLRKGLIGYR
ncbi:hypothetical protein O1V64_22065 [Rouxiella badensis]|nr:hypothetical protein O1V64_22065 [Rouxiella badensis]